MRIDYPIQITPETITALSTAVREPSGVEFALLLSLMSVRHADPRMDSGETENIQTLHTVNGGEFLNLIADSQTHLLHNTP